MGRFLCKRFRRASAFIDPALTSGGATGGDYSESLALELDMNDEQEVPALVHADQGIPSFLLWACVDNSKKRVEECLRRLFEGDPMLRGIGLRFGGISHERDTVQFMALLHARKDCSAYGQCQYAGWCVSSEI